MSDYFDTGDWASTEKMIAKMRSEAEARHGVIITASYRSWSICYSQGGTGQLGHIFSARLKKHGSKESDWVALGKMVALVGAPERSWPTTIETNPSGSHYWTWDHTLSDERMAGAVERARELVLQKIASASGRSN